MRFVNDDHICQFGNPSKTVGELPLAIEIRVIEHGEIAEVRTATNVGEPLLEMWLLNTFPGTLWCEKNNSLALV